MSRRAWLIVVAIAALIAALTLVSAPPGGARSVHDRTGRGYRAAFAWLAGEGTDAPADVAAWDEPFDALPALDPAFTLVLAWPLERPFSAGDTAALLHFATRGGRLVLLLDGSSDTTPPAELVEKALGITLVRDSDDPPYAWADWRAWDEVRREATGPHGTLRTAARRWHLLCPGDAETLAADTAGRARACRRERGEGEVVVVSDATVFQNDHLGRADNLALLDALLGGRAVRFAEWHHGAAPLARTVPGHVPVLLFAHLGALWLVAAVTLARRFGDPLPPPALPAASMARALRALASLHRGKGHAADAAHRLAVLLRARAARRGLDPSTFPAPDVATDAALVDYAARVTALQEEHRL